MTAIPLLPDQPVGFPNPAYALKEPDGLLAAGAALDVAWLVEAYAHGIFPWFDSDDDHILWWCPERRAVLTPGTMKVRRSLAKRMRNSGFEVSLDQDFAAVVHACSEPRRDGGGTWITPRMRAAYLALFDAGFAHSVEARLDGELVGGLYGVSLGRVFFGESMFAVMADASKTAFYHLQSQLAEWEFTLIDCQIMNPHLASLGVSEISREEFLEILSSNAAEPSRVGPWRFE